MGHKIVETKERRDMHAQANFLLSGTRLTEFEPDTKLAYGMLVKHYEDFEYFRHFVTDNKHFVQTCKELHLHHDAPPHHDENIGHNIFNAKGGPFIESLTISLIIVGVILLLGIAYEIVRWKAKKKLNVTNLEK